jgi:hypothetical protein
MSRYLVTYHGGEMPADPEAQQQVLQAFQTWAPASVRPSWIRARRSGRRRQSPRRVSARAWAGVDSGYTLLEASSLDDAVRLLGTHPYVSRGGSLQVSEPIELGV